MSPPEPPAWRKNANSYTAFTTLFALTQNDEWTFESAHPAYSPGGAIRAFGGHVYAQAVLAASRTVKKGFLVHNVTGHFLQVGLTNIPFIYKVSAVRDGGGYVQRRIDVVQGKNKAFVFTCVCSFKLPEPSYRERGQDADLERRYQVILKGRKPESWPEAPGVDSPYWWTVEKSKGVDPFPGLDMRKVDMAAYNEPRKTLDRRQLQYYRILGTMPSVEEDPNMHAAAHLYASDRNGLFPIPNFLDLGNEYSAIASLSHTVVFHLDAAGLSMVDENGKSRWFCIEESIDHISGGRGLMVTRTWDVDSGAHVLSTMQDGMLRMKPGVKQSLSGGTVFGKFENREKQEAREKGKL